MTTPFCFRYVAETGCDECRCHEPCREHRCQAGTECHAELVRANSVDGDADASSSSSVGDVVETRVQAVCRPLRKEGRCPEVMGLLIGKANHVQRCHTCNQSPVRVPRFIFSD